VTRLIATCHPDRLHKAYGLCDMCYHRQRYGGTKHNQYYPELLAYLESHVGVTWNQLSDRLEGRRRGLLAATLLRKGHHELVAQIDRNSGTAIKTKAYGRELVHLIEQQIGVDWPLLERVFKRSRNHLKSTLRGMQPSRTDLIWLVGNNTKEGT